MLSKKLLTLDNCRGPGQRYRKSGAGGGFKPGSWIVSCVTGSHHASECLLDLSVLGALQNRLEQQWILGDPLVWFGLHVAEPHPLTLRVSLHPLDMHAMVI